MVKTAQPRKKNRTEIGADKAREQLGDLINRAGYGGERFVLTRHGKPEVALVSIADLEKIEAA